MTDRLYSISPSTEWPSSAFRSGNKRARSLRTPPEDHGSPESNRGLPSRRLQPYNLSLNVGGNTLAPDSNSVCSPTPPLSATSSSGSSSSGSLSSFGSGQSTSLNSFSLTYNTWQPCHVGSPLAYHRHDGSGESPQACIRANSLPGKFSDAAVAKSAAHPSMPLTPATVLRPAFQQASLCDFDNQRKGSLPELSFHKRNGAKERVEKSALVPTPNAPALGRQQLDFEPSQDAQKPWDQQQFVEGLIDVSMLAIESIWPNVGKASKKEAPSPSSPNAGCDEKVLPLKYFVKETLKRSRSSCVTLQIALYYLHKGRAKIRARVSTAESARERFTALAIRRQASRQQQQQAVCPLSPDEKFTAAAAEVLATSRDPVICGRRMFLAALVCASKFLQDRTYSNRAWSRLSGLSVSEINANERALLEVLDYQLFMTPELYENWTRRLATLQNKQQNSLTLSSSAPAPSPSFSAARPVMPLERSASECINPAEDVTVSTSLSLQGRFQPRVPLSRSATESYVQPDQPHSLMSGRNENIQYSASVRPRLHMSSGPLGGSAMSRGMSFDFTCSKTRSNLGVDLSQGERRRNSLDTAKGTSYCGMDWTPNSGLRIEQSVY